MDEPKLRLTLLHEIPEDAMLRQQWNALALAMDDPQVFFTHEWALAVFRAYGKSLRPFLFLQYDDAGSLCGVAALAESSGLVSFLCATTGDYCDFLGSRESREAFVSAVLAELKQLGIKELVLANLPVDSATARLLRETRTFHCFSRTGYFCAQVSLADLERRGDAKPVLPRKKMLRRFLNAMGREAPVRLSHARSREQIAEILPEFMLGHIGRFLITGRISNMARPDRQAFLKELVDLLSEREWIVLTRMMSGERVFASNLGFEFQGTWFWYQPTFDSDLEKYSPGFCLLAKLIEESADKPGLKTVDLGLGAEEYKDRFANRTRETLHITLDESLVRICRERARYYLAEAVKSVPSAENAIRKAVRMVGRVRERILQDGTGPTAAWLASRTREMLWLERKVTFYEWVPPLSRSANGLQVQRLDLRRLAIATTQYVDDPATLGYLMRAASRLHKEGEKTEAYGLVDEQGRFVHFAGATDFTGFFLAELNSEVAAPAPRSVMIFDCWTPHAVRGHGHYAQTVEALARLIEARGKRAWIFSATENASSIRGLQQTNFTRRYSLIRRRLCGWQWIKGGTSASIAMPREISTDPADSAA